MVKAILISLISVVSEPLSVSLGRCLYCACCVDGRLVVDTCPVAVGQQTAASPKRGRDEHDEAEPRAVKRHDSGDDRRTRGIVENSPGHYGSRPRQCLRRGGKRSDRHPAGQSAGPRRGACSREEHSATVMPVRSLCNADEGQSALPFAFVEDGPDHATMTRSSPSSWRRPSVGSVRAHRRRGCPRRRSTNRARPGP